MAELSFGTSGLRGQQQDLAPDVVAGWVAAFLSGQAPASALLVGRDARPSSAAIARAVIDAGCASGWRVLDAGTAATPVLAWGAACRGMPAVMVTGSHNDLGMNGLKFLTPSGDIGKTEEEAMRRSFRPTAARPAGTPPGRVRLWPGYRARLERFFPPGRLAGLSVGLWSNGSVMARPMADLLRRAGAGVTLLVDPRGMVAVDTEDHGPQTEALFQQWAGLHALDAIVGADGDGDRPVLADGAGRLIGGDVVGLLTAIRLGAGVAVMPVTASHAAELCGRPGRVIRTRVGASHVIAAMRACGAHARPVGYERNGGVILGFAAGQDGRVLPPLASREAALPVMAWLAALAAGDEDIAALAAALDLRPTVSGRIVGASSATLRALLAAWSARDRDLLAGFGPVAATDDGDGVRHSLADGTVLHLRVSGNAPELRLYAEAGRREASEALLARLRANVGCWLG